MSAEETSSEMYPIDQPAWLETTKDDSKGGEVVSIVPDTHPAIISAEDQLRLNRRELGLKLHEINANPELDDDSKERDKLAARVKYYSLGIRSGLGVPNDQFVSIVDLQELLQNGEKQPYVLSLLGKRNEQNPHELIQGLETEIHSAVYDIALAYAEETMGDDAVEHLQNSSDDEKKRLVEQMEQRVPVEVAIGRMIQRQEIKKLAEENKEFFEEDITPSSEPEIDNESINDNGDELSSVNTESAPERKKIPSERKKESLWKQFSELKDSLGEDINGAIDNLHVEGMIAQFFALDSGWRGGGHYGRHSAEVDRDPHLKKTYELMEKVFGDSEKKKQFFDLLSNKEPGLNNQQIIEKYIEVFKEINSSEKLKKVSEIQETVFTALQEVIPEHMGDVAKEYLSLSNELIQDLLLDTAREVDANDGM